jgi:hypothetical protein
MRVAISVVAIALIFTSSPAPASPSCMTQSEARAKFTTSHLWWHGPNRCWDATPGRTQLSKRARARETKPAEPEEAAERSAPAAERSAPKETQADVKRKFEAHAARWRDAMSKMRPDDMPDRAASARVEASVGPSLGSSEAPAAPRGNFWDRWVEIAQRVPPVVDKAGPADLAADAGATEPIVTPIRVMLALLVLVLAFGAAELLLRRERRS